MPFPPLTSDIPTGGQDACSACRAPEPVHVSAAHGRCAFCHSHDTRLACVDHQISYASFAVIESSDTLLTTRILDNAFQSSLESNKKWAEETSKRDADFFPKSAKGQAPQILWLGCSDSRIPETTILGLKPGDVFTHRNIANMIHPTDLSLLSVVEFSVRHLKVNHVVLCGHTSCGGVNAALGNSKIDVLDLWLGPMKTLREQHVAELEKLEGAEKATYLSKVNVKHGVEQLRRLPPVLEAMRDRGLQVHGLIYDLATGRLEDLHCGEHESAVKKRLAVFETK